MGSNPTNLQVRPNGRYVVRVPWNTVGMQIVVKVTEIKGDDIHCTLVTHEIDSGPNGTSRIARDAGTGS